MDPFCWKAGAEGDWTSPNHSSMQIVQICPAFNVLKCWSPCSRPKHGPRVRLMIQ